MARGPDTPCAECGKLLWTGSSSLPPGQRRCLDCKRAGRIVACAFCGTEFRSRPRGDGQYTRTCGKACARKLQVAEGTHQFQAFIVTTGPDSAKLKAKGERANRARRARLLEVATEPYTLAEIAERDGFRCGLCHRRVDMARVHPAPGSPSIDHIVPLAAGGDDLKTNVQLAHLRCNLRKQARVGYAQPLLFG